jgi:hypothetical protein
VRVDGPLQHHVEAEDPLDDLGAGEDPARLTGQGLQDGELLRGQRHLPACHPHLEARGVQLHLADPQQVAPGGSAPTGATEHGPYPGGELAGAVRLGEVVVGAEVQAQEHVLLGTAGGEQQNRNVGGFGAQNAADIEPVDVRQHYIEYDEIRLCGASPFQCCSPVGHDLNGVTLTFQINPDEPRLLTVVLSYQNASTQRFSPPRRLLNSQYSMTKFDRPRRRLGPGTRRPRA